MLHPSKPYIFSIWWALDDDDDGHIRPDDVQGSMEGIVVLVVVEAVIVSSWVRLLYGVDGPAPDADALSEVFIHTHRVSWMEKDLMCKWCWWNLLGYQQFFKKPIQKNNFFAFVSIQFEAMCYNIITYTLSIIYEQLSMTLIFVSLECENNL